MDKVTEIVSFNKLKIELRKFFDHIEIPDELTKNTTKWNDFVGNFIEVILDCPLVLSTPKEYKKVKPIYEEIVSNPIKEGAWVVGFTLSYINNRFFKGVKEPFPNATLCLVLTTSDTTRLVVPLSKDFLL